MLIVSVFLYFLITLAIGYYANKKISSSADFITAGRNLHPVVNAFALFALWFGSETLMGASSEFYEKGLLGIIEDPLGGVLCLLLVGFVYSKKMYRLNVWTIGDLFRDRMGTNIEFVTSLVMAMAFIGYIAAQLLALGMMLNLMLGLSVKLCVFMSMAIVITYTYLGGMWAVSLTDFFQSIMIIIGLSIVAFILTDYGSSTSQIIDSIPKEHFKFFPNSDFVSIANWFAAWSVLGLGSIVSQDVFQRVNAARSEKAAFLSSIAGAIMYMIFSVLPILIISAIRYAHPESLNGDLQMTIPHFIKTHMPEWIKVIFFGAVISAIMSTASGALLAPATLISENIIKPIFYKDTDDKKFLFINRLSVIGIGLLSVFIALGNQSIFELVGMSSVFSLVSLFYPFTALLFFNYSSKLGVVLSITLGAVSWLVYEFFITTEIDALIIGSAYGLFGLLLGWVHNKISVTSK